MDAVDKVWAGLYGSLRQVLGPRRWALFRETSPGTVEDGRRLVLDVAQDFHLESLRNDAVVGALVATQASDLLGFPIEIGFRKIGAAAEIPVDEEIVDKERLFEGPAENVDPKSLLERELGATVVDDE